MSTYRIYSLNEYGRIGYAEEIDADGDRSAIDLVRERWPTARQCELWEGRRLVATMRGRELVEDHLCPPDATNLSLALFR